MRLVSPCLSYSLPTMSCDLLICLGSLTRSSMYCRPFPLAIPTIPQGGCIGYVPQPKSDLLGTSRGSSESERWDAASGLTSIRSTSLYKSFHSLPEVTSFHVTFSHFDMSLEHFFRFCQGYVIFVDKPLCTFRSFCYLAKAWSSLQLNRFLPIGYEKA